MDPDLFCGLSRDLDAGLVGNVAMQPNDNKPVESGQAETPLPTDPESDVSGEAPLPVEAEADEHTDSLALENEVDGEGLKQETTSEGPSPLNDIEDLKGSGELPLPQEEAGAVVEALLFATRQPLGSSRLARILGPGYGGADVRRIVTLLNQAYGDQGRTFSIEEIAGGYQILTAPRYHSWIRRLKSEEKSARLSEAALDTLAVVAYRQPILKADVNHIRGVESGPLLRTLIEKNLIRIAGRAEQPGRPILYGTTKKFLEFFGLKSLKDLPSTDALN